MADRGEVLALLMPDGAFLGFVLVASGTTFVDGEGAVVSDCVVLPAPKDASLLGSPQHAWLALRAHTIAGELQQVVHPDGRMVIGDGPVAMHFAPTPDGRWRTTGEAPPVLLERPAGT